MSRAARLLAIVVLLACACLQPPAMATNPNEPILVPEVSNHHVEIHYSFHGTQILLYGAILYPHGQVPKGKTDIAVILRGPSQTILIREKQKLGGIIWANAASARFNSAPATYAIASSSPLQNLVKPQIADIFELGVGSLQLSPSGENAPEVERRFIKGLVAARNAAHLYQMQPGQVNITSNALYSATLDIPARVPEGVYSEETYLIYDGKVIAAATRDIDVKKYGFERLVSLIAARWPFFYGLLALSLSVFMGWVAGVFFKRMKHG
jgi:uncharacterized protein (TIGR02186 family)